LKYLITGAGGLIGSEAVFHFTSAGHKVFGIDNDMRSVFFGSQGSVRTIIDKVSSVENYDHFDVDITDKKAIDKIFKTIVPDVVIHCAAQPSHDKAAEIPFLDFNVNAFGTLNLLENMRKYCNEDAVFVHMSTNKVYGDGPNNLKMKETDLRYDFSSDVYTRGIDEHFSIDNCMHSLFGASKVASDIIAQEYGKYFDMNVGIFRGGCLTGPQHSGVEMHGFLSYIIKCAISGKEYTIFGYKGKQVRDQIHSYDVISAFDSFIQNPSKGEVFNIGGGKSNSASILEIIEHLHKSYNINLNHSISKENRKGDHICYYTDLFKIKSTLNWNITKSLDQIIDEMVFNFRKTI
tara:strand:+ start:366 stop:1409 length:1044 start_codon:yes stop_codon:yes gene_type:complete